MKKLMKKKVNVFGKSIPVFAILMIGMIGLGSAALMSYFGVITGAVTVTQGLTVDNGNWETSIEENFPPFTSLEQKTFVSLHNLQNNAETNANVNFENTCAGVNNACNSDITTQYAKWTASSTDIAGTRPSVIYDNDHYEMWYEPSAGGIQYVTSSDGLEWTTPSAISGAGTGDAFFVTKEGGVYYMINYGADEKTFDIYTSNTGLTWADKGIIFTNPTNNGFAKIDNPKLLKTEAGYNLYFQAKTDDTSVIYKILLATTTESLSEMADDDDDDDFTVGSIIVSPGNSGEWDDYRVMQPMVIKEGNQYIMMYSGYSTADPTMRLGYAVSTNGITFTKVKVSTEGYDDSFGKVAKPSLVNANGDLVLFYIDDSTNIAIATLEDAGINTVPAGETEGFFIVNKFARMLVPDTYTIETKVTA